MQGNTSYSHYLHRQTGELWCAKRVSISADNVEQKTSCEHRICLSIVLVMTLTCTLHSFNHSCCLTLKVFLRGGSFRTVSAGGSSVLESCSDLVKSVRRSVLRLELDFETFWLHFKGWVHCTSLLHIVNTEPVTAWVKACMCVLGLCLGHGYLVVIDMWNDSQNSAPKSGHRERLSTEADLGGWGLQYREMGVGHWLSLARAEGTGRLGTQSRWSVSVWSYRSCLYASHWSHSVCYT